MATSLGSTEGYRPLTRQESKEKQNRDIAEKIRRQEAGERAIQNGDSHFGDTERRAGNEAGTNKQQGDGKKGTTPPPGGGSGSVESPTLGVHLNKLASFFEKTPMAGDMQWLANTLGANYVKASKWFDAQITYLKGVNLESIKGGAQALWGMITTGKWGEIGTAVKEAPAVAQVATAGVIILSAVAGVGLAASGSTVGSAVIGKIAGTGIGKFILGALAVVSPIAFNNWGTFFTATEQAMNFNWNASDKSLFNGIKAAIERIFEPMGSALGKACASVAVGRSTGTMKININVRTLAMATLIGTSDQSPAEEAMLEALTEMCSTLRRLAGTIVATLAFMGGRKIAGYLTGNNDWGDDGGAAFIPREKVKDITEKMLDPLELDDKVSDALEEGWEEFYDTVKELLTDDDTWVNFVRA